MGRFFVTCQVIISAGDNGTVTPVGEVVVDKLSYVYLHAQPEPGYQVEMWYVNGNQMYGITKEFRVLAEEDNLDVEVTFDKI